LASIGSRRSRALCCWLPSSLMSITKTRLPNSMMKSKIEIPHE
jgi:hypothetical protein